MTDLFADRAADYDARPLPQQISEGVFAAMEEAVAFAPGWTTLDFGAGTGLIATKVAPRVGRLLAVDISPAMLEQLRTKALPDNLETVCQNLLEEPLGQPVDLVVSAMAAHHVEDTSALLGTLFDHLVPGGQLALADLDTEPGTFHPADIEGVFHHGFDREALAGLARAAGFTQVRIQTATTVQRDDRGYPIFLLTATKPVSC